MTQEKTERRGGPRIAKGPTDGRTREGKAAREYIITQEARDNVVQWAKVMSKRQIALKLGITNWMFDQHFLDEYERARWDSTLALRTKLLAVALKAQTHAPIVACLRAMGEYSERIEVTGRDGGPVQTVDLTPILEGMTDEELELIGPIFDRLVSVASSDDAPSAS